MTSTYKNILVINTMHIGDLMLVTPALRTLRANYPKAHIALLTDKPLADLVRCNENIDECILIDKHGRDKGILALIRFIRQIRKRHFDLVINYHRNERASAIASFSGGKKIVGYAQPFFHRFFDHWMPNLAMADTPKDKVMHQTLCHLKVLQEAAGCTKLDDRGLEMWLPPEEEKKASDLWQKEFAEDDRVIAFNIGASWMTKRWIDAYGGVLTFIPMYTRSLGIGSYTSLFFLVFALVIVVSRPFVGYLFDHHGSDYTVYPGFLFFSAGFLLFSQVEGPFLLLLSAAVLGIGFGALAPAFQTIAVSSAPSSRAGVATSTYFWSLDISVGFAAAFLGLFAEAFGYSFMYGGICLASSLARAVYYFVWRRGKQIRN